MAEGKQPPHRSPARLALYLRVPAELMDGLDALTRQVSETQKGRSVSKADVIREILFKAIKEAGL